MIVKCDACQTRFKIPDEKVTEKGVKVRCTKCSNTFRVVREAPAFNPPADAPVALPSGGQPADPFAALGFAPPGESTQLAMGGGLPGPAGDDPFANIDINVPSRDPQSEEPTRSGYFAQPGAAAMPDPFAAFGPRQEPASEEATRPAYFGPPGKAPAAPFGEAPPAFGIDEEDPFSEPTRVAANPLAGTPVPASAPAMAAPPPLPRAPAPMGGGTGTQIVAPGNLADQLFGEPPAADASTATNLLAPDRSAFGGPAATLDPSTAQTGQFSVGQDRGMFDIPPPPPPSSSPPLGFGEDAPETTQPGFTATKILPTDPSASQRTPPPTPPPPDEQTQTRQIPIDVRALPTAERQGPGAARALSGAVVNIAIAALLLIALAAVGSVYLNEGRLEWAALSPDHLKTLWKRPPEVVTRDVSNGLYDAQGGHPVLFVRGEVENRTARAGKVKVKVEIFDGQQLLRAAEVFAGKSPTPEDLAAIGGPNDLDALTQKLNEAAKAVGPKGRAPFLVAFYEYPTDLTGLRLKVTTTAVP
jgi:predicted Zn finger-like uncharacterized protein